MHHRFLRVRNNALAVLLGATLVAAGCGANAPSGTVSKTDRAHSGPRTVSKPASDPKLDAAMGEVGAAARTAGCTFGRFDEEDAEHVDKEDLRWDTFPPASGQHLETWAPWGLYGEQVADGFAVHNLEHGGVVVWIGNDAPPDADKRIKGLLDDGEKWLVAPRDDLDGITALAWATGLTCPPAAIKRLDTSDEEALTDLLDRWFDVASNTGSKAEKDIKAFPGSMAEPEPKLDTSVEP